MTRLLPDTEVITEEYARQRDYVNLGMHHCEEPAQFTRDDIPPLEKILLLRVRPKSTSCVFLRGKKPEPYKIQ